MGKKRILIKDMKGRIKKSLALIKPGRVFKIKTYKSIYE